MARLRPPLRWAVGCLLQSVQGRLAAWRVLQLIQLLCMPRLHQLVALRPRAFSWQDCRTPLLACAKKWHLFKKRYLLRKRAAALRTAISLLGIFSVGFFLFLLALPHGCGVNTCQQHLSVEGARLVPPCVASKPLFRNRATPEAIRLARSAPCSRASRHPWM